MCAGGGQGILMMADCLGREFTSRTANYDLIIGLPQFDTDTVPRGRGGGGECSRPNGLMAPETRTSTSSERPSSACDPRRLVEP